MRFNVRFADPREVETVMLLVQKIFPNTEIEFGEDDLILVAEDNRVIRGFAHLVEIGDKVILQGLGVDESYRGFGVGSSLLDRICELCDQTGKQIFLKTKVFNPAVELYGRHGFSVKRFGLVHVLVRKQNS